MTLDVKAILWTDAKKIEPKQNFKWIVNFLNYNSKVSILASSVTKPNFKVQTKKFKNINIEKTFTGDVSWSPIQITFVDNTQNDALAYIANSFKRHGLDLNQKMINYNGYSRTEKIHNENDTKSGGFDMVVELKMLDNSGKIVEKWVLSNPIPSQMEMSPLDYKNDDLSTYKITIEYDWAYLSEDETDLAIDETDQVFVNLEDLSEKNVEQQKVSKGNARSRPEAMQFEDLFPSGPSYESAWSPTSIGINEYKSTIKRGKQGARAYELGDSMTAREENYRRDSSGRRILTTDVLDK